jgi:hypothetical protein
MNVLRRKRLARISDQLEILKAELEDLLQDEEEARDNIPEGLQESPIYEKADMACDNLQSAIDSLEETLSSIEEARE